MVIVVMKMAMLLMIEMTMLMTIASTDDKDDNADDDRIKRLPKDCPCKANKLALAGAQIVASLFQLSGKAHLKPSYLAKHIFSYCYVIISLLAPTGALIVIVVYYISAAAAATFSDFHSVNQCN